MQNIKKCFREGLIQFTILLSLVGNRVNIDSYLISPFHPLLIEITGGPGSAFVQTPFHPDTAASQHVHHKCPELEYYFSHQRLLHEVHTLGSPVRFHTRLSAWLVHLESNSAEPDLSDGASGNESVSLPESILTQPEEEIVKESKEEINPDSPHQLTQSSAQEQEVLLSSGFPIRPGIEVLPQFPEFLSGFRDFESLIAQHMSDMNPVTYNVSLQDAMVCSGENYSPDVPKDVAHTIPPHMSSLCTLESFDSSSRELSRTAVSTLALPQFFSLGNISLGTSHSRVGGYLDEAVFEQINLLGLESLDNVEGQVLNEMDGMLDGRLEDSDSGLSLENSSRSPASTSMSSSGSFCEGGAMGYSSEVEFLLGDDGACAFSCNTWSQVSLNKKVCHDHSYSARSPKDHNPQNWAQPPKAIKQEVMSEDETVPVEPCRDERRLHALGLPFSAPEIVNMPVEDFLELLEGQSLSTPEVMLLRDVRRRGKNKLAAQNCRQRKLHAIVGLQAEVEGLAAQRDALLHEITHTTKALAATAECFKRLSHVVLRQLRDENGRSLSPEQYTLHCGTNGQVVVRPRTNTLGMNTSRAKTTKRKKDKKP